MTVQIPEDVKKKINVAASKIYSSTSFVERIGFRTGAEFGYSLSQQKLQSFRKKLENITIDELLKNTGIILELFDEHFK